MSAIERLRALARDWHEDRATDGEVVFSIVPALTEHDAIVADRDRLQAALVDTINAIGNGSAATPGCSTDFLVHAPEEVRLVMAKLRADRDRLAARVAELEAADLVRESAQREADIQTLVASASDVPADREAQGRAWAASCVVANGQWAREPEADADPCPVLPEALADWSLGIYLGREDVPAMLAPSEISRIVETLAWLTRRAMRGER